MHCYCIKSKPALFMLKNVFKHFPEHSNMPHFKDARSQFTYFFLFSSVLPVKMLVVEENRT